MVILFGPAESNARLWVEPHLSSSDDQTRRVVSTLPLIQVSDTVPAPPPNSGIHSSLFKSGDISACIHSIQGNLVYICKPGWMYVSASTSKCV